MNITLTPAAARFIRLMVRMDGGPGQGFSLAVTPGGCAGLNAEMRVQAAPAAGEAVCEIGGTRLFLNAESRLLLDGVTIDFTDTPAKTGLVFLDPKPQICISTAALTQA